MVQPWDSVLCFHPVQRAEQGPVPGFSRDSGTLGTVQGAAAHGRPRGVVCRCRGDEPSARQQGKTTAGRAAQLRQAAAAVSFPPQRVVCSASYPFGIFNHFFPLCLSADIRPQEHLRNSTFCFVLPGDGYSGRLEDALANGCIPVIVQARGSRLIDRTRRRQAGHCCGSTAERVDAQAFQSLRALCCVWAAAGLHTHRFRNLSRRGFLRTEARAGNFQTRLKPCAVRILLPSQPVPRRSLRAARHGATSTPTSPVPSPLSARPHQPAARRVPQQRIREIPEILRGMSREEVRAKRDAVIRLRRRFFFAGALGAVKRGLVRKCCSPSARLGSLFGH